MHRGFEVNSCGVLGRIGAPFPAYEGHLGRKNLAATQLNIAAITNNKPTDIFVAIRRAKQKPCVANPRPNLPGPRLIREKHVVGHIRGGISISSNGHALMCWFELLEETLSCVSFRNRNQQCCELYRQLRMGTNPKNRGGLFSSIYRRIPTLRYLPRAALTRCDQHGKGCVFATHEHGTSGNWRK